MSLENLTELLKKNEVNSIFSHEKIWKDMTPIHEKYKGYLSPDSQIYHSVINPIFSFEMDAANFRIFSLLSLRDGVYPLIKFFAINPTPHEIDPVLVIDSKLSSIVPKAWRGRVILRDIFVKSKMIPVQSKELMLLISPDKDSLPLSVFESELDRLKDSVEKFNEISVFFSSCNFCGEEDAEYDTSWGYKLLKSIFNKFPGKNISILDYNGLQKKNVSEVSFYFLNPLLFYFSDSYLLHDLLQRGAMPLEKPLSKSEKSVDVSIYHGFNFHCNFSNNEFILDSTLKNKIFKGTISQGPTSSMTDLKLSTQDFKHWAGSVASKIYLDFCHK